MLKSGFTNNPFVWKTQLWPPASSLSLYSGLTHVPIVYCDHVISLQVTEHSSVLSAEHFPKEQKISPTFLSSPPQFPRSSDHETKARSHRAISEDSSPEIPSHSVEMVLMGKKGD